MHMDQNQARYAGIALVVLGVVALLNLWGLVPVALLAGVGYLIYRRKQALGQTNEAVQGLLWGVGLAVLLLLGAIWPGILLLGGASLLARGREAQISQRADRLLAPLARRHTQPTPPANSPVTIVSDSEPTTGETVRLR